MKQELQQLPQFTITQVELADGQCAGIFDSQVKLGEGWIGYLTDHDGLCIKGRFSNWDSLTRQSAFKPGDVHQFTRLVVGRSFAYLDGYWGERVAIVFDTTKHWREQVFKPDDVIEYLSGGKKVIGKVGQLPSFPVDGEGKTIQGGWDHEHCAICWETISQLAQPAGYTSQEGDWICKKCYSAYVQPKLLGFLDEEALSQIRGE
jgi:hypothetical protein